MFLKNVKIACLAVLFAAAIFADCQPQVEGNPAELVGTWTERIAHTNGNDSIFTMLRLHPDGTFDIEKYSRPDTAAVKEYSDSGNWVLSFPSEKMCNEDDFLEKYGNYSQLCFDRVCNDLEFKTATDPKWEYQIWVTLPNGDPAALVKRL